MEQFTASEVRNWERAYKGTGAAEVFNAFADLLEAQEKAVPVYQHRRKSGPIRQWFDCSAEEYAAMEQNVFDMEHFDRRILYTHPAPADAERLAEALQPFANLLQPHHASMPDDRPIYGINKAEITAGDLRRANEALTAHSAQAQPPVASVPTLRYFIGGPNACAYVDKHEHVEAVITALCECTGDDSEDYTATDLLAAQENPNG